MSETRAQATQTGNAASCTTAAGPVDLRGHMKRGFDSERGRNEGGYLIKSLGVCIIFSASDIPTKVS